MLVPAAAIFACLVRIPELDLAALGFNAVKSQNHPCNVIISMLLVLPPVSRPAMRTVNLKTGNPFVVEDTITSEYQTILQCATALCTACDRNQLWLKYMELHTSIERIILDQNKGYTELTNYNNASRNGAGSVANRTGLGANASTHVISMRSRWVGKSGRIRREGMGKRVNFCARSVVTCDSYIAADEIMVPRNISSRLTYPVVVHPYNIQMLNERMRNGEVLFMQRASGGGRMRSITHVAIQNYVPESGDCLIRRGLKYRLSQLPLPCAEDIPLPIQCAGPILCFGDRIRCKADGSLLDPLQTITWPTLQIGDTVLVTPKDGDWCLINRQPTLVQLCFCWYGMPFLATQKI